MVGGSSTPLSGSEPMNMLMVDKPASETLLELLMICQPRKGTQKKKWKLLNLGLNPSVDLEEFKFRFR